MPNDISGGKKVGKIADTFGETIMRSELCTAHKYTKSTDHTYSNIAFWDFFVSGDTQIKRSVENT